MDQDPNWTKILDPDPSSMNLDPQYILLRRKEEEIILLSSGCNKKTVLKSGKELHTAFAPRTENGKMPMGKEWVEWEWEWGMNGN